MRFPRRVNYYPIEYQGLLAGWRGVVNVLGPRRPGQLRHHQHAVASPVVAVGDAEVLDWVVLVDDADIAPGHSFHDGGHLVCAIRAGPAALERAVAVGGNPFVLVHVGPQVQINPEVADLCVELGQGEQSLPAMEDFLRAYDRVVATQDSETCVFLQLGNEGVLHGLVLGLAAQLVYFKIGVENHNFEVPEFVGLHSLGRRQVVALKGLSEDLQGVG